MGLKKIDIDFTKGTSDVTVQNSTPIGVKDVSILLPISPIKTLRIDTRRCVVISPIRIWFLGDLSSMTELNKKVPVEFKNRKY